MSKVEINERVRRQRARENDTAQVLQIAKQRYAELVPRTESIQSMQQRFISMCGKDQLEADAAAAMRELINCHNVADLKLMFVIPSASGMGRARIEEHADLLSLVEMRTKSLRWVYFILQFALNFPNHQRVVRHDVQRISPWYKPCMRSMASMASVPSTKIFFQENASTVNFKVIIEFRPGQTQVKLKRVVDAIAAVHKVARQNAICKNEAITQWIKRNPEARAKAVEGLKSEYFLPDKQDILHNIIVGFNIIDIRDAQAAASADFNVVFEKLRHTLDEKKLWVRSKFEEWYQFFDYLKFELHRDFKMSRPLPHLPPGDVQGYGKFRKAKYNKIKKAFESLKNDVFEVDGLYQYPN